MIKRLTILLLLISVTCVINAQDKRERIPAAPVKLTEPVMSSGVITGPGHTTADANYIAVDTSANAFGGAGSAINPLAYDPSSDVVALVYRGDTTFASGSGELWYSISTDRGQTWRRISAVNTSNSQKAARYPSMTIANPAKGGITETIALFSWPELNPASFGFIGYAAEQPVGGGAPFAGIDQGPPAYGISIPCWSSDNSSWLFWAADNQTDAGIYLWRTQDLGSIENIKPPQWSDTVFSGVGNLPLGADSWNGTQYYAVLGTFSESLAPEPILSGWYPGYSKSTDNGATWNNFKVADWRNIPALSKYDRLYDWTKGDDFVSYDGDMRVDKNGFVHLIVSLTAITEDDNNTGVNAVVDIFETENGWDGRVVYEGLNDATYGYGPGIAQMGPSPYIAFNQDRDIMAVQFVNSGPDNNYADIYLSYANLGEAFSAPENLTNSPQIHNTQSHFAPYLAENGDRNFTAFSFYAYQAGATGPQTDSTRATALYVAPVNFTVAPTAVNTGISPINSFELSQNYPNPFNPVTNIKYSVAKNSKVTLKVFDMLGREIVTLVNTTMDAGVYDVRFDASELASGLYLYTLNTGDFISSRVMLYLK
ncbi:MAG: T9SS type A sorting domain-containing protein [Ignavibacteriaceae bacterium]